MLKFLGRLFLLAFVLGLAFAALAAYLLFVPFGPSTETFVDIAPGTGTPAIALQMQRAGIIRSRYSFFLLRKLTGGTLRAGEYRFDHPAPVTEVYAHLRHGDVYTIALTIPEGYNIFDIAQAVETAGFGPRADFLAAERQHTELIAEWAPHATSLEGFLFPATYQFARHATPLQMLTTMVRRFRQASGQLGLQTDIASTVTLASLIEKEVSVNSERPLVAGVFANRLARNMPLETDPAVVYAALLEGRYRGTIFRSDLQADSPYNTYKHPGLPPGPICNPGMAALRAALHPQKTDYLFFVADANGHTRFSTDLKEHHRNVEAYRSATSH